MNIFVSGQNTSMVGRFGRNSGVSWHSGDVIQAILTDVSGGKATLRTSDDTMFTADASSIQGQVGDTLTFQVNRGREGFTLTQILDRRSFNEIMRAERGNATLIDGYEENKELLSNIEYMKEAEELRAEYRQERDAKILRVMAAIRRAQNFVGGANPSVFGKIAETGLDISKLSFAELSRVMQNVERDPGREISQQEMNEGLNRNWIRPENARQIVSSLFNHGLSISDKNVHALEQAYERLPETVNADAIEEIVFKE